MAEFSSSESKLAINVDEEEPVEKPKADDLDLIFQEIGEFNPYQIWKFVLLFVPIVLSAVYAINFIMTASNLDYR